VRRRRGRRRDRTRTPAGQGHGVLLTAGDIAGGLVITAIGVNAVRHIGQRREFIGWPGSPCCWAAHQSSRRSSGCGSRAMCPRAAGQPRLGLPVIAFVVLPALVPLAVIALEPTGGEVDDGAVRGGPGR